MINKIKHFIQYVLAYWTEKPDYKVVRFEPHDVKVEKIFSQYSINRFNLSQVRIDQKKYIDIIVDKCCEEIVNELKKDGYFEVLTNNNEITGNLDIRCQLRVTKPF